MVNLDTCRSCFPTEMVLLRFALFSGIVLSGCKDAKSDFVKKQQTQETAVVVLTNLGAKLKSATTGLDRGWIVDLSQLQITPEIVDQLKILESSVNVLNLNNTSIDDSQLAELIDQKIFATVVELDLSHNPAITNQSIEKLERLPFLYDLNLTGTQITAAGIARLQKKRKPDEFLKNDSVPPMFKREFIIRH